MTLAVWQLHGRQQLRNWWCNQMASAVCAVAALWGTAQVCVAGTVTWAQPALTVARTAFSGHPWWKWVTELFSWVRMLQTRKQVGDRLRSVEAKICNNNRLFDCAYTCLLHWTNFWTRDVQIHQKLKKNNERGGRELYISFSLFQPPYCLHHSWSSFAPAPFKKYKTVTMFINQKLWEISSFSLPTLTSRWSPCKQTHMQCWQDEKQAGYCQHFM